MTAKRFASQEFVVDAVSHAMVVAVAVTLVVVSLAWLGWLHRQSLAVVAAPASDAQLPCLSYAPFRRDGHTPFDAQLVVTPAQIEEDLRILASATRCVRTYGVDRGTDAVPAVAQKLGMQVMLGAWIGRDPVANQQQLDRALALATAHPNTVKMIVVGNEVLLRRELAPAALAALLSDARKRSPVPVAYADVWEFWLRHASALRQHVDVVAVHVLPYWEDDPVAVQGAVAHVRGTLARVQQAFPDKRVWLGETGWPAAGRQRGPAVPGRWQQASFVRAWLDAEGPEAATVGSMNFIEGFDQPWKRALEGTVGAHWGLFDAAGRQRVAWQGQEPMRVPSSGLLGVAAVCGLLGAAWAGGLAWRDRGRGRGRGRLGWMRVVLLALTGACASAALGAAATWQWRLAQEASVDAGPWALALAGMLPALVAGVLALAGVLQRLAQPDANPLGQAGQAFGVWDASGARELGPNGAAWVHLAWLAWLAILALQLVFDGRYRDVLWPLMAATATLMLAWRMAGAALQAGAREERAVGLLLACLAPAIVWQEGWVNGQAWTAAWACAAAAVSVVWPGWGGQPNRMETH